MTKNKIVSIYLIVLLYAVYLTILGQLLPRIIEDYSLSMSGAGLFSTLQSLGGITAVFSCIFVVDALNKAKIFGACAVLLSITTLIIGLTPQIIIVYVTFAVLGIATGFIDILSNVVIADRTSGKRQRLLINLLHGFFSTGAVAVPILAEAVSSSLRWSMVFVGFAIALLICAVIYHYSYRNDVKQPLKQRLVDKNVFRIAVDVLHKRGMKCVALSSICTNFFLVGIIYWLSTFMSSFENNYSHGALGLSLFFAGVMVSRLGLSKLSTRINAAVLVGVGSLCASVLFIAGLLVASPYAAAVLFLLCGAALGPVFPQTVSMACHIAQGSAGTASGFVFFGFIVGNMISPLAIGAVADIQGMGLKYALIVPAMINIIGAVAALCVRSIMRSVAKRAVESFESEEV